MCKRLMLTLLLAFFLIGCGSAPQAPQTGLDPSVNSMPGGGTETGNPAGGEVVFLSYQSSELLGSSSSLSSRSPLPLAQLTPSEFEVSFRVTKALGVVRTVVFDNVQSCPDLHFPLESTVIDFLTMDSSDQEHVDEKLSTDSSCHPTMTVTFGPLPAEFSMVSSDLDPAIIGRSLLIRVEGAREDPIEFRTAQEWTAQFGESTEWVDPAAGENLIVGFDRDGWFAGIDLEDPSYPVEMVNGEAVVVVDAQSFPEVLQRLIDNKLQSRGLFKDKNGNRMLELDEYLDPILFLP